MAVTREDLRKLIDRLPDSRLDQAAAVLSDLAETKPSLREILDEAPFDDEPLTPEEMGAIGVGEADYAAGRTVPMSQIPPRPREPIARRNEPGAG